MDLLMQYEKLINKALKRGWKKNNSDGQYVEGHHIIPRGWWDTDYIVYLTPKEHFTAHRWLFKIFPDDGVCVAAYKLMCEETLDHRYKPIAKHYEEARKALSDLYKIVRVGEGNPNFGNRWKMSKEQAERTRSSRIEMLNSLEGLEYKKKMSGKQIEVAKRLRDEGFKRNLKLIQCPHCGREGKGGNMTRYHFDKCKHKNSG